VGRLSTFPEMEWLLSYIVTDTMEVNLRTAQPSEFSKKPNASTVPKAKSCPLERNNECR
jgi:hypothetical protein